MGQVIDLNADLGESFGPWVMGDDAAMLGLVSSANIACGGHAGDPEVMFATVKLAQARGVRIGAHPGYADLAGFGRRVIPMPPEAVGRMVAAQVGALIGVAAQAGARVEYVNPHGALGNLAADDRAVAAAIVDAVAALGLPLLAISGTMLEQVARARGVPVYSEVFADRGYLSSGRLVPRGQPGAMLTNPEEAAARLVAFLQSGLMPVVDGDPIPLAAQSVCVHGDSPGAVAMAQQVRAQLTAADVIIAPFLVG